MKSAQQLYEESVAYENLRNSFATLMRQYKQLENALEDQAFEIEKLERHLAGAQRTISELSRQVDDITKP